MIKKLKNLPLDPGIYFFLDKDDKIIYIGKAKNLRHRVLSYWQRANDLSAAKQKMLNEIKKIQYTIVDNEIESLLLEASQIKKHQPKYNIVLKDDKNWGYIVISQEDFPRLSVVHGRQRRRGQYFGPYTSTMSARIIVQLLHRLLPLRLSEREVKKSADGTLVLELQRQRYFNWPEKILSRQKYQAIIDQAKKIIAGNTGDLEKKLRQQIILASAKQNYELASLKKNQLLALARLKPKQKIIARTYLDQDIINIINIGKKAALTLMRQRQGVLGDKFNFIFDNELEADNQEILENFINQYYARASDLPRQIVVPQKIKRGLLPATIKILVPQKGQNKNLLTLVAKNALDHWEKSLAQPDLSRLLALQNFLQLKKMPWRIEIYDISNIQGKFAVGAMVVWRQGVIAADQFRIFKIKKLQTPNDVAMLAEVIERRLKHRDWPEPDLIVLDGGKPQLNHVLPLLPEVWRDKIIALAKKKEEIFAPGKKNPLKLSARDPLSLYLQNMRNQAHKFAIKNYRRQHRRSLDRKYQG